LENTWLDIYDSPEELGRLIDLLVAMNLAAIEKYAAFGAHGYIFADDWGLQTRLMISPHAWREIWKPRYARIFKAVHDAGMLAFLHSCGYIVDILDDLIGIGLDVIQMDQQENMGLELLGERFGGRITFFNPVDIQTTMAHGSLDEIRAYCRKMVKLLSKSDVDKPDRHPPTELADDGQVAGDHVIGGFIPKWYSDPVGAGHRQEMIDAMCEEFIRISKQ
ncbi:MAG TPA: uroporphyrinogen decarboxylase family protein, partial [bacterium]